MKKSTETLEKKRLHSVAREYRKQGCKVLLYPSETDLPSFLSGFQPDLIAYSDKENVVVEVKSKVTLSKADYLPSLASAVNSQPGWRLDLIVTNPARQSVVEEGAEELSQSEIHARLESVRQLLSINQEDAATLLAWSAAEATLRLVARRQEIELEENQPLFVINQMYSLGALSRKDYQLLQEGMRVRNLIVHGFRSPESGAALVRKLMKRTEELLETEIDHSAA